MEALSYCQLMERCLAAEARVVELAAENVAQVEVLEEAKHYIERLREWNAGLAQESCEQQQRISELLEGKLGNALLERENHHVEVVDKLLDCITELESHTVKLPKIRRVKLVSGEYVNGWTAHDVACALSAAGIKMEVE